MTKVSAIREHWDKQAALGIAAGTQDLILKALEQQAILTELSRFGLDATDRVLEAGCGHGELAHMVADQFGCEVTAIDTSAAMIKEAKTRFSPVFYSVGDVLDWDGGAYDAIYTERCLINLPTWEDQKRAIDAIAARLNDRGVFLMCEHSQEGLDAINAERARLDLPAIERPWHNKYIRFDELQTITSLKLVRSIPFSAAYYFLSRIVNAKLATDAGEQPKYDAPINQLALTLPYWCVDSKYAQGRLTVWEKA